ncbi:dihydrofolate reductase family protein [Cellulosimicrobium sp. NPDC057127]|uniref:dihydrofolate reductase family protein n=1 Tax=Cellulosimicrobium sp. NPDC057127 TaxID=3346026 RepID=UPI003637BB0E
MSTATPPSVPHLDLLVPQVRHVPPEPGEATLAALYAHDESARGPATVRANMVASLDGAAWGPDERSGTINDAADGRVFRVLRALADVVLVGAGTARAEGYTPLDRPRGLEHLHGAPLELAVVTRSGRVPERLSGTDRPPFVLTGSDGAARARAGVPPERVLEVGSGTDLDLAAGLRALSDRGLTRVLAEGGPTLLAQLLAADLVDELCVTTTPRVVGPGPGRIVAGAPAPGAGRARVALPRHARLAHLLHAPQDEDGSPAGTTLARWLLPIV